MGEIIAFDGARKRFLGSSQPSKTKQSKQNSAKRIRYNIHDTVRVIANWNGGYDVDQIAAMERMDEPMVNEILREHHRPTLPVPERSISARLLRPAA